ncbi:phosphoglycerate mutase family protein [Tasmannia lanceolata]|uniref:phosphoglycerate mutase family protein n=1 Tax=Tasmannia lanceolata TaxID=3420 RepID=UPI00406478CF
MLISTPITSLISPLNPRNLPSKLSSTTPLSPTQNPKNLFLFSKTLYPVPLSSPQNPKNLFPFSKTIDPVPLSSPQNPNPKNLSPFSETLARRCLLISLTLSTSPFLTIPLSPPISKARGLFQMPPPRLNNRYFLVRAGESEFESFGIINTNPVAKTSIDSGLSDEGKKQTARAAIELKKKGACSGDCWVWPSITQRSYQAAEIIASVNGVTRSRIVPEYSFLDARGLGAYEGKRLESVMEVYESDSISPSIKPPPIDDGTPNESVADVFVRVTQLMSIIETQYSGDTIIIVSPDSDNLTVLQAGLIGLDLRRHRELSFSPGEVRLVDPKSIPTYKQPASAVYKCLNPPSCT